MEFDLRALQLQVESVNSVEASREVLTRACEFLSSVKDNDVKVKAIFELARDNIDYSKITEPHIFFYDADELLPFEIPEEFKGYSIGLYYDESGCRFADRLVYPIRDPKGFVMGLCGWDMGGTPKYLDSRNYGYNAKNNTLYGMELLPEYYRSNKSVFFTEGIVCTQYLRTQGFQAMSLLGSSISKYVLEILKRFGDRCVLLPDNDKAGLNILKSAKYNLPKARCYTSIVAKDIDDTRKMDNNKYERDLLADLTNLSNYSINPFCSTKILVPIK